MQFDINFRSIAKIEVAIKERRICPLKVLLLLEFNEVADTFFGLLVFVRACRG